ncbi:expressed unknown protein [Seminavis robusta]|uniref:Uncharacterized protein n=1 Tax=Seminavis robusta TaxID=568900 RepID=A0A9N8HNU4_9STRA|nr:expressed unknown protein [Seminavis robusta]|eukprot:Sro850_g210720.1 n/a (155) ;mRNA; r:29463-30183
MFRLFAIALLLAAANAFAPSLPAFKTSAPAVSSSARFIILSDSETDAILKVASECAEGECSIDEVAGLVGDLKEQQQILERRMSKIMTMIAHLEHVNEKEDRQTDEVRQFVKDMLRVFAHEKATIPATGFSGEIGDGPTTAYDALPPKKWKASP